MSSFARHLCQVMEKCNAKKEAAESPLALSV